MSWENIIVEKDGALIFIIINRPEVRNALNKETLNEIQSVLREMEVDESIQCIVFTGAGEKSFAAGADIGQLNRKTALEVFTGGGTQLIFDSIESCPKPTIAMINGYALGGGCELA